MSKKVETKQEDIYNYNILRNTLIIISSKEDLNDQEFINKNDLRVLNVGAGKLNASICLTSILSIPDNINRISCVMNLGSAFSLDYDPGTLVNPLKFYQEDIKIVESYDSRKLNELDKILLTNVKLEHLDHPYCLSADSFENINKRDFDDKIIKDGEAFSLAKVCLLTKVPFISIKCISGKDVDVTSKFKSLLNDLIVKNYTII